MSDSPAVILYDSTGTPLAVVDGATLPVGTRGLIFAGVDNSGNVQFLRTDSSGRVEVFVNNSALPTGAATELTLLAIKDTDGIKKIVDALPAGSNLIGKIQIRNAADTATLGDNANPLRIDPTGTTPQPVTDNGGSLTIDGTVTSNIGTTNGLALDITLTNRSQKTVITNGTNDVDAKNTTPTGSEYGLIVRNIPSGNHTVVDGGGSITVDSAQLPSTLVSGRLDVNVGASVLPTGAATEATLATRLADSTFTGRINTFGQKTMDNSTPVVLASDQSSLPVTLAPANSTAGFSFGEVNTAALTATTVRKTTYTEQASNAQRSIVSASANDTAAGTGARTVKITYLDSSGNGPFTETVTLNGVTAVNTIAINICFIEKMEVVTAGSGGVNAGIISLKATTGGGGATIGTIAAGDNATRWAHHYVPVSTTCSITSLWAGHNGTVVGSGGVFFIKALTIGVANSVDQQVTDSFRLYGQSSSIQRTYGTPIKITGPTRLVVWITPESSSSLIYRASFDYYEQ